MVRVLHLGNIANNALHNARLFKKYEFDSTVVCYDYFDPMASPEWDEANFDEQVDFDYPDWTFLRGQYERPKWFVQGYAKSCRDYLLHGDRRSINKENGWESTSSFGRRLLRQKARLDYHLRRFHLTPKNWMKFKGLFAEKFPDRKPLTDADLAQGFRWAYHWGEVLEKFDIVMAYACEPIIPMLFEVPYVAFEHGTLRDIPFEDSARGRLTALAYAVANHVFVTNFDCLDKAHEIVGNEGRVTFINHPFDESILPLESKLAANLRRELSKELSSDYLIYFPTRHDWVSGNGYADKGNDLLIRAVSELIHEKKLNIGLVVSKWGNNQAESRQLIHELGISAKVKWVNPQPLQKFYDYCNAADLVCDQFKLGSFGGVFFKALLSNTPVCSYLDEQQFYQVYPELPPIINGNTVSQLARGIEKVITNVAIKTNMAKGSNRWMRKYHNSEEVTKAECEIIQSLTVY